AVLAAVPTLFRALQLIGGGYVLYLGLRALQSALQKRESGAFQESAEPLGAARSLRQGFLTNALNPKASITFLSVLPQFVPAGSSPLPRTLQLAAIVVGLAAVWFQAVALLVDRLGRWLRRPRTARAIEAFSGTALVALGASLLIAPLLG
ncbi:LysE family translocator, partial [Streptomyces sp. T-3]|nr:LysE family translocator [Streptomyces sp. T-3]